MTESSSQEADRARARSTDHHGVVRRGGTRFAPMLTVMVATVALLFSGCSSDNEDSGADDQDRSGDQADGGPLADVGGTGSVSGTESGDQSSTESDELTFTIENPDEVLDPDNVPEVEMPELLAPGALLPEFTPEVVDAIAKAAESPDIAILDAAGIIDDGPTDEEVASFRDGNTRNSSGELVVLDELAALACANVEIALSDIDSGDLPGAVEHIIEAAARAADSELVEIQVWSSTLKGSFAEGAGRGQPLNATVLVGFLQVCIDGGYVL